MFFSFFFFSVTESNTIVAYMDLFEHMHGFCLNIILM